MRASPPRALVTGLILAFPAVPAAAPTEAVRVAQACPEGSPDPRGRERGRQVGTPGRPEGGRPRPDPWRASPPGPPVDAQRNPREPLRRAQQEQQQRAQLEPQRTQHDFAQQALQEASQRNPRDPQQRTPQDPQQRTPQDPQRAQRGTAPPSADAQRPVPGGPGGAAVCPPELFGGGAAYGGWIQ